MIRASLPVFAAAAMFAAPASAQLINGDFELPDASAGDQNADATGSGFTRFAGTEFITADASAAMFSEDGNQALKIFGPFAGGGAGVSQLVPAAAGLTYTLNVDSLNSSLDQNLGGEAILRINFLDANGDFAANDGIAGEGLNFFTASAGDSSLAVDTITNFGLGTAPAPLGTTQAEVIIVRLNDSAAGGSQFFDNAVFQEATPVPEPASLAILGLGGLALLTRRR